MSDKHIEPSASVMETFKALKGEARSRALKSRAGTQFYAALETKELEVDDGAFAPTKIQSHN